MAEKIFTRNRAILIVVVLILLATWWFWPSAKSGSDTIKVFRGTITQAVDVTGQTKPSQNVEMSFDRSGRIAFAPVSVGEQVYAGEVLASLDSNDLQAQLNQGLAQLEALKKGSRPEDVGVSQSALDSAKASLIQALQSSYNQADDAFRNHSEQLFNNQQSDSALLKIDRGTYDDQYNTRQDVYRRRLAIKNNFVQWYSLSHGSDDLDLTTAYKTIHDDLIYIRDYLDKLSSLINPYEENGVFSSTVLSGYRAEVSTARSEINTALSSVVSATQAYVSAENQLALKKAPPTVEAVAAQEAVLEGIRAQMRKNMIISPIDGVITRQDANVGETAAPGVNVITVMSSGGFLIEADVPEVDVGKIKVGDQVKFTLDAFSGENWTGKVVYVEPAETIVDGVVNYRIKISIDQNDSRMKSGLTANLTIITAKKDGVLILPQYAIVENDKGSFVEKISGQTATETPVTLGIRSQDGNVEVVSGVGEGDSVQNIGLKKK